jgi:hypothetical protein
MIAVLTMTPLLYSYHDTQYRRAVTTCAGENITVEAVAGGSPDGSARVELRYKREKRKSDRKEIKEIERDERGKRIINSKEKDQ